MKSLKVLLLLGFVTMSLSACDVFQARDRTYDGDPQIEFSPNSAIVEEGAGTVTTDIQLIGPQRDSDLSVSFSVADSSTAVDGEHYSLGSTSATIPANSSSTEVSVEVLDNNQDDGETNYVLYLGLEDSDGVKAAENYKTFTLTIRGADE